MSLTPKDHHARGRTDFLIHGDSKTHPGQASKGCVVLLLDQRQEIASSVHVILVVTP